ncbi:redoxin family protein [Rufibacter sp. LB8]|uniref:redoxin family protein n=1 Tax=Rufibacter sp. LB8 TaxID=2777781 RepID=UPI00178C395D|nr:redoxin family protein [Rufibacter sp. LB8]
MKRYFTLAFSLLLTASVFAQGGYRIGSKITDFTLKDPSGQSVPLSSFSDAKAVVVVFTSVKCPYSKLYDARLQAISQNYGARGVRFVYVNAAIGLEEGTAPKAQPDQTSTQTFPYLVDEGQNLSKQFGATKAPEVFVLQNSADGFYLRYKGAIDDNPQMESYVKENYLRTALDNVLANKTVTAAEKRATGCLIKRF